MKKLICVLLLLVAVLLSTFTQGDQMATPEIEKKLYTDLSAAHGLSTTAINKALKAAYKAAADAIVIPPPVVVPPVVPPVVTPPPVTGAWPKDLSANPTGKTGTLPARTASLTITEDGKVITGFNVDVIYVKANNVTIKKSKTRSIQKDPGKVGLVIEDSIIDGENQAENAVQWSEYTCRRTEITRTTDAFKAHGNVTVEDCWIHDLNFQTGANAGAGGFSHNDGVQVSSGNNVTVKNTRIENTRGNAGVFVDPDQGTISNVLIQNNFFTNVGNYMVYVKESSSNSSTGLPANVTIKDNIFGVRPDFLPHEWGEMKAEVRATNLVWSNNKTADGKAVNLDSYGKGVTAP